MVAGLPTQRAAHCQSASLPPVYFLLTTTPDRASRISTVLSNLQQQSLRPHRIVLTAARHYADGRFHANASSLMGKLQVLRARHAPWLVLNIIDKDRGPLSKYFGATSVPVVDATAIAVIGDDDMFYGRSFVEDYACAVASAPSSVVFSSGIDQDCGGLRACVMGFRGVGLRANLLRTLPEMPSPRSCFLADDVVITYFLVRRRACRIHRLRLRSRYKFDHAYAWANSSINSIHRAQDFGVNRKCARELLLA
jgi:hypothetical protein